MILRRKAILIIHGFAGGTYDQEFLANYLERDSEFDVYTYTLPGHSYVLNNKSTYQDWILASENMMNMLIETGYRKIYVIGHSMGGVISAYLATKYSQINKLVLVAPAFRYFTYNGQEFNLLDALKVTPEILSQYGKDEVASRLTKLPIATVKEFVKFVTKYQTVLESVETETLIIQGTKDKIVPPKTAEIVYNELKSKHKKIIYINNSTHDVFRENKKEGTSHVVKRFLKRGIKAVEKITAL